MQPDPPLRSPRTTTPPNFGPLPPRVQGFPAQLDDAALGPMFERRQGFASTAFFSEFERSGAMYFSDLMDHQRLPATHYERTSIGRLEYEVDAHYLRWRADAPETATTLLALLHAAEASPLHDWELAAHLWRHAREIEPAPVEVFERLDHHFRVVRALHLGAAITGPVTRDYKAGVTEVPAGLAAAAASAYPDAGSFDSYGGLPLTVVEGRATVEAMLPAAHQILHEHYDRAPVGAGDSNAYEIMHVFDGHRAPR